MKKRAHVTVGVSTRCYLAGIALADIFLKDLFCLLNKSVGFVYRLLVCPPKTVERILGTHMAPQFASL